MLCSGQVEKPVPPMKTCLACHNHDDQFKSGQCYACHLDLTRFPLNDEGVPASEVAGRYAGAFLRALAEEKSAEIGRLAAEAARRYPMPILSMLSVEKVATPPDEFAVVIPASVAPLVPVPLPIATVTEPVNPVAGFSRASRAATFTAGAIAAPATVVPGCIVNPRWVAGPDMMSNFELSVGVRVPAVAWSR